MDRIVVKLGTGVLTDAKKQPDLLQLEALVGQVARQHQQGREVVIVTSGAVGAGMGVLGYDKRPGTLDALQACAAIGQSRLMAMYEHLFSKHGIHIGQVLLTHEDLEHHERHLNARNTLITLLRHRVIPIVNENDAVSTTELKFGDNDKLSALVACLLPADLLVILTTVDGLIENFGTPEARVVTVVKEITASIENSAGGTTSATAVGGMATKIQAAKMVTRSGIPLVIASGKKMGALNQVLSGSKEGTLFAPSTKGLRSRKRWIAFFHHPKGALYVDDGARRAIREKGTSLLSPGVERLDGRFKVGDVVRICDIDGLEFARGKTRVGAAEIGAGSEPKSARRIIVHRDDLVVL